MKIVKERIAFVQVKDLKDASLQKLINLEGLKKIIEDGDDDFFVAFARPKEIKFFKESDIPEYDDNIDNSIAKVLSK